MKQKFDAVVAGHICLDIIPRFKISRIEELRKLLAPGSLVNIGAVTISTGGAVSNTGLAMHKLGLNVQPMGKIGDDFFGEGVLSILRGYGLAESMTVVSGEQTSYTIVLAPGDIDRMFLHHPGANDTFCADDIKYEIVKQAGIFHLGYPTLMRKLYSDNGRELIEIFKRVKGLGVTTSLDVSLPEANSESGNMNWGNILSELLQYVDIFMPSIEEAAFLLDRKLFDLRKSQAEKTGAGQVYEPADYVQLSGRILNMGGKIICLKAGIRGLYARTCSKEKLSGVGSAGGDVDVWSERELWAPSLTAEEIGSATGAGDATIAGFIAAWLRGYGPEDTLQIANILGWQNVRGLDALSAIENWPETLKMLADKNRRRNILELDSNWRYSGADQLYYGPNDKS
ncbi:MAG: carbohydrate kinase family protein [Planctomycetota bacterium]|jgi:sugar/nucleoside kinase (ribokinase family)